MINIENTPIEQVMKITKGVYINENSIAQLNDYETIKYIYLSICVEITRIGNRIRVLKEIGHYKSNDIEYARMYKKQYQLKRQVEKIKQIASFINLDLQIPL